MIALDYFWFVDLIFYLFSIMGIYTSWYKITTELTSALGRDPAEIQNEFASLGGGF